MEGVKPSPFLAEADEGKVQFEAITTAWSARFFLRKVAELRE